MEDKIIEFKNINKKFGGIHAVKNVSFSINKGEVHTIMGENGAGKSTLMNILSGIFTPDGGEIIYKGNSVDIKSPLVAKEIGISVVFQELKLSHNLTVVENIFLGREYRKNGFLDWKRMNSEAQTKLQEIGLDINVQNVIDDLSTAQMQQVEIAKAMFIKSEVLILDEPTSSLTYKETTRLFEIIEQLKNNGVAIIFISHRMEEVLQISDRISIMRNGEYLGTYSKDQVTPEKIVSLISNKEESELKQSSFPNVHRTFGKGDNMVLEVNKLNRGKKVRNISFKLYQGEILGFYGLEGSGRTELMETLYGLYKYENGEYKVYGEKVNFKCCKDAIKSGISMVPENRKSVGLFMNFDVKDNIASIHDKDILTRFRTLNGKYIRKLSESYVNKLSIRTDGITQMVKNLSGGNQQKVVMSKSLSINPRILILDEPTKGVDIGAKSEIYDLLHSLRNDAEKSISIIIVSSELSEVVTRCDRVLIMRNGNIVGELVGNDISSDRVLQYAFNG